MELKTLWLGLVLSLAAFAVKTGLGWAYLWQAGGGLWHRDPLCGRVRGRGLLSG